MRRTYMRECVRCVRECVRRAVREKDQKISLH